MLTEPTKKGKEIEEYLNSMNMEPWFYIYENYVRKDSKEKSNQVKQDSSDQIS
ncbi:MAG: hypothetical protein OEL84_04660 [Nitrosopumilus sp.]|nr:hypothetical protein [Nitrosopumilus sp.]MDH3340561.1 hypothetical protein [Nitrosopumilus sp.]